MTDHSERAVLNRLIATCKDAVRGFRAAAEQVTDESLRSMLLGMAEQRQQFADDLLPHAQRLGGANGPDGTAAGAIHRSWMGVRHAIAPHDDVSIVKEAERGEHFALGAYMDAIEGLLPAAARVLVESQLDLLEETGRRLEAFDHLNEDRSTSRSH
jgi:uncharacterized protein (TIGR02284 family)